MKKKILSSIALLTMAVVSCTENIVPTEVVKPEVKLENRDLEEIIQIAQNAPSLFEGEDGTRRTTNAKKEIDLSSITSITNKGMTRTSGVIDTLLYVMNYADNDGYVIVSSKQGTPGVIAYIEEGQYDLEEINNNQTNIGYVTDLATTYINNTERIYDRIPFPGSDTVTFRINPLIQTKWGQRGVEGTYCPNGVSGCVNTAIAQICAYYEYPDTIQLTYKNADKPYQILDWNDIKKHKILHQKMQPIDFPICPASTESHNAIGRLCRQLGELTNSTYFSDEYGTGTEDDDIVPAAEYLGFTCKPWVSYTDSCTLAPLQSLHPLLVSGFAIGLIGHVWIIDGYLDMRITTTEYLVDQQTITTEERFIYNHVNWGWDGKDNGYIFGSIFNPSNMYSKDPSIHGDSGFDLNFEFGLYTLEMYRHNPN